MTVSGDLEDVTGGVMEDDYNWSFTTIQPDVVSINPSDGSNTIPLDESVIVRFSQAMDPATTEDAISLRYLGLNPNTNTGVEIAPVEEGEPVSGEFKWSDDGRRVVFYPGEQLQMDSVYAIVINEEVARSATGATLREGARAFVYTVPYPQITGTTPADGETNASPYGGFTIYFNTNMDLDTLEDKVIIDPEPWREFDSYYYDYSNSCLLYTSDAADE